MDLKYDLRYIKSYVQYPLKCILDQLPIRNYYIDVLFVLYIVLFVTWVVYLVLFRLKNFVSNYFLIKETPLLLHKAVVENNVISCIRLMEKCPLAVNVPLPPENYTPFLRACLLGNTQLVKLMIKYGADLSLRTARNETCFYLAVYSLVKEPNNRDASCIHALYYAGVDVNATNDKGFNALQLAAIFGHTALVRWLLAKGANRNVIPYPYVLARTQGHSRTASVLKTMSLPSIQ